MPTSIYLSLLPLFLMFPIAYFLAGLYPAIGIGPIEEFRRLTISTSGVFLILGALSFFLRNAEQYSRLTFIMSWVVSLALVPTGRHLLRRLLIRIGVWGEPVALIGLGEQGYHIYRYLISNPQLGLKPKVIINGFSHQTYPINDIPIINVHDMENNAALGGIRSAILVPPEVPSLILEKMIANNTLQFPHLILVSENWAWGTVSITPYDMGNVLGLEVRQNLLLKSHQTLKRLMDLGIILISSPIWLTLFGICALLVYLDSPSNVFFCHPRIGQNGRMFKVWKFRTMVPDAETKLQSYLENHPGLKAEWEMNYKLKDDVRVTWVGKILRRLSLDELPQFWNVILGEMSLVGPRPIVEAELAYYGAQINTIQKVKPGITGLWQVSGRNDIEYKDRILMDEYYVRNWSIWFDIYIIINTFSALLSGKGAY